MTPIARALGVGFIRESVVTPLLSTSFVKLAAPVPHIGRVLIERMGTPLGK